MQGPRDIWVVKFNSSSRGILKRPIIRPVDLLPKGALSGGAPKMHLTVPNGLQSFIPRLYSTERIFAIILCKNFGLGHDESSSKVRSADNVFSKILFIPNYLLCAEYAAATCFYVIL